MVGSVQEIMRVVITLKTNPSILLEWCLFHIGLTGSVLLALQPLTEEIALGFILYLIIAAIVSARNIGLIVNRREAEKKT
jgi:hypothetical protein